MAGIELMTCIVPLAKANKRSTRGVLLLTVLSLFSLLHLSSFAATKTSTGDGNWSASATWSPSGVPSSDDNVVIRSGDIVTVDGTYTCNNLNLGNSTNSDGTLQITSANNSLTVNGDFQLNPSNKNKTYTLDAGPGTINIAGTFSLWGAGTSGGNIIEVSTGAINFTPAVTISSSKQSMVFNGAGTITFNGAFTDQYNKLTTYAGCTVNFKSSYTVNTTASDWASKGTAVFWNGSSITPTAAITFYNLQTNASASVTLNAGAGAVIVGGTLTLASGSTLTTNKDFEVGGDWTNNGGTFTGTNDTLTLNASSGTIGGTSSSTFRVLRIGRNAGSTACSYTMNSSVTTNYLRISAGSAARTLTVASGKTLTVNNDLLLNQPTANAITASLSVNAGTCNVSGNMTFSGTDNTITRIAQVAVTSGTFSVSGTVTWMSNTAVATEVITVSTGTVTFGSSLTMGSNSGTLAATSTGTINFNGSSAPSLSFGGIATAPALTTTSGCILNFANGFTNSTNPLTLTSGSTTVFTGSGTVTPTAAISFSNVQINSGKTVTLAGDISVGGNWTNNGGTLSGGSYTVTLEGNSNTIGGSSSTSFPTLRVGKSSGGIDVSYTLNANTTCNYLILDGSAVSRTLTISSGITLTVNNDATLNQPAGINLTNTLAVNAGTCTISGNLIFSGTNSVTSKIAKVAVTSGSFTLTGTITWMSNTVSETEVISVSTGTVTFNSSQTMGTGSGTIEVRSTGTFNFSGNSTPSLLFGGATAPVLTTTSGCYVNFEKGFTTVTTSLSFASGSNIIVGSPSSATNFTVDPSTTITNNGTTIVYGDLTATSAATFVNAANATLELRGAVSSNVTLTATATGNTVKYKGGAAQTVKATTYYNLTLDSAAAKTCGSGVVVNNNLTVQGAATFNNTAVLAISGNFIYSSTATTTLANNLTTAGLVLNSGTLNDGGYNITINNSNGWSRNGGTFTSTGTVIFGGSTASTIAGSLPSTFTNLTMNNAAGVTLNVSPAAATVITGALTLTSGKINTTSTNVLKLTEAATTTSGSNASYVSGPMTKVGNTAFTFPLGRAGRWMRAGVSGMSSAATEVTAEFFNNGYSDVTTLSGDLTQVSPNQYWMIDRTGSSDAIKIRLYWENATYAGLVNCNFLTIAHYTGGQWQQEAATPLAGSECAYGGGTGSIETNVGISSFSPFSFGGTGGTALPIKLMSFDAVANGSAVDVNWMTAMELNNDYFTVEKSTDGINYSEVAKVDGAGNSTAPLSYHLTDANPFTGLSYYRLRQTDYDGQATYMEPVGVRIEKLTAHTMKVYPNPAVRDVFVEVNNPSADMRLSITDVSGREVYARDIHAADNSSFQKETIPLSHFTSPGVYFLTLTGDGRTEKERVVVR